MSQQNAKDQNQMEVVKLEPNQNQVAVVGAITSNGEPQPEVFKLDTDCWDDVFDCLSLKDVHSFGQTCKAFQRVTGAYFQWKYEAVSVRCFGNEAYIGNDRVNGFINFVQKIRLDRTLPESNFESVKQVKLICVDLHQLEINSMKVLSKVEHLELWDRKLDGNILGALIESCVNLKRLEFWAITSFNWSLQSHPTLQHLALNGHITFRNDQLKDFLGNNPNIRSLQITAELLWGTRDSILKSNIGLDDLAITDWIRNPNVNFLGLLTDLHGRGFYRRLHLKSYEVPPSDRLLALQGLVALYFSRGDNIKLPLLVNIRELGIHVHWNTQRIQGVNTIALASRFMNLERLFIARPNFEELLPFIRHSINLKYVEIEEYQEKVIKIYALNKERKKLEGARKVTIYVDEDVYLATKWAKAETSVDLIEIKRKESHYIVRPHNFWVFFRSKQS
ncbi:uncharacterized protein LOC129573877 [Sitodiplosis mosellana]|uniref:uncharacterized protein LOC129573877 n=1 Tax=Sitodiplosis mosellana TaxID=263140 RepID=UPI0024441795|nr:uncharacterized protein LOC129573877 [Sitodiplosis mosellana]XP_055310990.1 uncharacterized protein LOC129573877 [Sitodiplosis mosellana]